MKHSTFAWLKSAHAVVGTVAALGLAGTAIALTMAGTAYSAAADPLTSQYAQLGHMTLDAGNAPIVATVSSDEALTIAEAQVGGLTPASVHHGSAAKYLNSPIRDVWLVSFTGVQVANHGPTNAQTYSSSYITTVVVDSATGEVLRIFSVSP